MVFLLVVALIFQVLMASGIIYYVSKTNRRDDNNPQIEQNTATNSTIWNSVET